MFKYIGKALFHIGVFRAAILAAIGAAGMKTVIGYFGLEVQEMPDRVFTLLVLVAVFAVATAKTYAQNQYDSTETAVANTAGAAKSLLTWIKTMGGDNEPSGKFRQALYLWLTSLRCYIIEGKPPTLMTGAVSQMEDVFVAKRSELGNEFPWLAVVDLNNMTGYGDFAMRLPSAVFVLLSLAVLWKLSSRPASSSVVPPVKRIETARSRAKAPSPTSIR